MEFITNIINNYGAEIIGAILTAVATLLGAALKKLATKYINTKIKREIARTVVRGVEQLYKDLNGEEKLGKALEAAAEMLTAQGIVVSDLELRLLLEDAVGEFNDVFNSTTVLEGIAVEDLDDEQLRELLQQIGYAYTADMTREEMLAALEETANAAANT